MLARLSRFLLADLSAGWKTTLRRSPDHSSRGYLVLGAEWGARHIVVLIDGMGLQGVERSGRTLAHYTEHSME